MDYAMSYYNHDIYLVLITTLLPILVHEKKIFLCFWINIFLFIYNLLNQNEDNHLRLVNRT